ncbi:MAG: hypothetical protein F6K54_27915 [Okeania sp. SIO3B5]|uniref:hypothetical protein n=1 Tax=Okeania sp. SIO3B5 TaxID=2607811 RepID=UPI0013FEAD24|nr:hypothetical protein [Okeania sp. SIO3B5]NEO56567.1 hypothetical protein [Okeania sp. SIO3B5]
MNKIKPLAKKLALATILSINLLTLLSVEKSDRAPLIIEIVFQPNSIEVTLEIEMSLIKTTIMLLCVINKKK